MIDERKSKNLNQNYLDDLNNVIARNVASMFAPSGASFFSECVPHLWGQNNFYPFKLK